MARQEGRIFPSNVGQCSSAIPDSVLVTLAPRRTRKSVPTASAFVRRGSQTPAGASPAPRD